MKEPYEYKEEYFENSEILPEKVTFQNFYHKTIAAFTFMPIEPSREPDYISYRKKWFNDVMTVTDEVSSVYWFEGEYVIRKSDHWSYGENSNIATCWWTLETLLDYKHEGVGYCHLNDFEKYEWL